ncbi:MAG: hypothetical protein L6365_21695 [Desulfobulbaceae bacterium]|nr:hypothetical protein [Desulfobulbaceae bacterium]
MDLERNLIAEKGPNKSFLEQQVFAALREIADYCVDHVSPGKRLPLTPAVLAASAGGQEKSRHALALELVGFAKEMCQLKSPRDPFNNKRKSLALDIIGRLDADYDMLELMELCISALQSNKKALIFAAAELLESRCARNLPLEPEIIKCLDRIISKTRDRSVAVAALNVQVEASVIDEFEALSRIDDWREENS